jgi:hypothetical protein
MMEFLAFSIPIILGHGSKARALRPIGPIQAAQGTVAGE